MPRVGGVGVNPWGPTEGKPPHSPKLYKRMGQWPTRLSGGEGERENNYSVATCEWPMGRILCRLLPQLGERESWVGPKVRVLTPYPPLSLSLFSPTKIALQQRSSYFCLIVKSHSDLALATDWRLSLAGIVPIPCVCVCVGRGAGREKET